MGKEGHELGVVHSWMEVGGVQCWWRRRHRDCYMRYSSLLVIM